MAFEPIPKGGNGKAATKMEVGEELIAYFMYSQESVGKFGKQTNMLMQDPDSGDSFTFYTGGTLKHDVDNGRIRPGLLTKITRQADVTKQNKNGQPYTTSVFDVEQDPTDVLADYANAGSASKAEDAIKDRVNKAQQ